MNASFGAQPWRLSIEFLLPVNDFESKDVTVTDKASLRFIYVNFNDDAIYMIRQLGTNDIPDIQFLWIRAGWHTSYVTTS